MGWLVVMAVFAAFGLWIILLALLFPMISGEEQPILFLDGKEIDEVQVFPERYAILRELGCRVVIVTAHLTEEGRRRLENSTKAEIWTSEEYLRYLETERKRIAGTGNGDHPGCD